MIPDLRIGHGWDSHEFVSGRPLWLGGLQVEHTAGLGGHSDGDVLLHAVCDALLGALALDDIGAHFPSSDPRWKDAASSAFVLHAIALVKAQGWQVVNLDATVILERPRMHPLRAPLRASLARLLDVSIDRVSLKAKTPEGIGTSHAAIAHAVVLLAKG